MSRPHEELFYDEWGNPTSSEILQVYIETLSATVKALTSDSWVHEHFLKERTVMEEQIRLILEELELRDRYY